jgi:hypothetical protein
MILPLVAGSDGLLSYQRGIRSAIELILWKNQRSIGNTFNK